MSLSTAEVSSDTNSIAVELRHARNKVSVSCAASSWPSGCTAALRFSPDGGDSVPFAQMYDSQGNAISFSATYGGPFELRGGGYVDIDVDSFSGSDAIVLSVSESSGEGD